MKHDFWWALYLQNSAYTSHWAASLYQCLKCRNSEFHPDLLMSQVNNTVLTSICNRVTIKHLCPAKIQKEVAQIDTFDFQVLYPLHSSPKSTQSAAMICWLSVPVCTNVQESPGYFWGIWSRIVQLAFSKLTKLWGVTSKKPAYCNLAPKSCCNCSAKPQNQDFTRSRARTKTNAQYWKPKQLYTMSKACPTDSVTSKMCILTFHLSSQCFCTLSGKCNLCKKATSNHDEKMNS